MPYAVGTFASRAAVMSGSAHRLAARGPARRRCGSPPTRSRSTAADLEIVDGVVQVKGAPGAAIALGTVAVLSNPLRYAFDEASKAATQFAGRRPGQAAGRRGRRAGPRGPRLLLARAVDVRLRHARGGRRDRPATPRRSRSCATPSCTTAGTLINPMIVEGQIHGGVAQGVGGALYERMAYDEAGQLLNASFMDFLMPYVTEVPDGIDIDHLETPSPLNPLGHQGRRRGRRHPVRLRSSRPRSRTPRASRSPPCRSDTAMPISPSRARSPCASRTHDEETPMKISGADTLQRAGRAGLGRRCSTRAVLVAHDPRLRAAGGDRGERLRDDGHRRGRRDQGHLRRRLRAVRPASRTSRW